MTQELNTKVTGFDGRLNGYRELRSRMLMGNNDSGIAVEAVRCMGELIAIAGDSQSALAAKDAEIAELRGLVGELVGALEEIISTPDNIETPWKQGRKAGLVEALAYIKEKLAKLTDALAQKGGE